LKNRKATSASRVRSPHMASLSRISFVFLPCSRRSFATTWAMNAWDCAVLTRIELRWCDSSAERSSPSRNTMDLARLMTGSRTRSACHSAITETKAAKAARRTGVFGPTWKGRYSESSFISRTSPSCT
jgi:hypothetical protein